MTSQEIVPELYCSDFPRSLRFYTEVLGFGVRYVRQEDRFAYLDLHGAALPPPSSARPWPSPSCSSSPSCASCGLVPTAAPSPPGRTARTPLRTS